MAIAGHGVPVGTVRAFYNPPTNTQTQDVVIRAPFYVPRPSDDFIWMGSPLRKPSSLVVAAVVNPFIPGTWRFNNDDPSAWQPTPQKSINLIAAVAASPFIPGKWRYSDEASVWYLPIQQKSINLIAAAAASPFAPNTWDFNNDDYPVWSKNYINLTISMPIVQSILRAPFYVIKPDDAAFWLRSSSASKNALVPFIPPTPFVNVHWNYSDDAAYWPGKPVAVPITLDLSSYSVGIQSFAVVYANDDPPVWYRNISQQRNTALSVIPTANHWRLDPADDQLWSVTARRDILLLSVIPKPFVNMVWNYSDDSSTWLAKPASAALIPMLTVGGIVRAKQWHWDSDDATVWYPWINRDLANATSIIGPKPFVNVVWNYSDDQASWTWKPPSISYAFTTGLKFYGAPGQVPTKQWHYDYDDQSTWWNYLTRNTVVGTVQIFPNPFVPVPWRFNVDDPPPWQQPSQRSIALPFVPSIVNRWRLVPADDQLWSLTARQIIVTQVPSIQNRWRLEPVDDQLWSFTAQHVITSVAAPFANRPYISTVDEAVWQSQTPHQNWVFLTKKPNVPVFWSFNYNDQSLSWKPAVQRSKAITLLPQSAPFTLRQSSFFNDDYGVWKWQPPNIIVQLKWNINVERIANTSAENRIVKASAETRTAPTTPEIRTSSTKVEARFATTTKEIRIAIAPDEDEKP
jgi:hypothetical protein